MQVCNVMLPDGMIRPALYQDRFVCLLEAASLAEVLHSADPPATVEERRGRTVLPVEEVILKAPVDQQEIWAAGVTYKRSQEARERESEGAGRFYDLVYNADRPELFLKAPAWRVVGPGEMVNIRRDARWNVPEPEVALVIAPDLRIVGYTIGNDMSSRDIEGENPLYLPQAKVYDRSCAIGPVVTLAAHMPPLDELRISLTIERGGQTVFHDSTPVNRMKRSFTDLVSWLGRELSFPDGAILLTGTGLVPPDSFTLAVGDRIRIALTGVGELINVVGQR